VSVVVGQRLLIDLDGVLADFDLGFVRVWQALGGARPLVAPAARFDERGKVAACVRELPAWYKWWLHRRGQSPEKAARHLIGYSNTTDFDHAEKREAAIRKALGFESAE